MNLIIVREPGSAQSQTYQFDGRNGLFVLTASVLLLCAIVMTAGIFLGTKVFGPRALQAELQESQQALASQQLQLAEIKAASERDINALALRLGRLQAEATRLKALGDRLARDGKVQSEEFDFSREPGVGGPEVPVANAAAMTTSTLGTSIESLESEYLAHAQQLNLLERIMLDSEVERAMLPAGMPVATGFMVSNYGTRHDPFTGRLTMHAGIDFDGHKGQDIMAVAGGVVIFSGVMGGYGYVVDIDHGNGYLTRYAHNSKNVAKLGQAVRAGEVIAKMGSTGRSTGDHSHFEVHLNGHPVNPIDFVRKIRG